MTEKPACDLWGSLSTDVDKLPQRSIGQTEVDWRTEFNPSSPRVCRIKIEIICIPVAGIEGLSIFEVGTTFSRARMS